MYIFYLELCSFIRMILFLLISWKFSLKKKYQYLCFIEFGCLLLLNNPFSKFLQTIAIIILMSSIYGTLLNLLFGWFSPNYWRENNDPDSEFLLNQSNYDNLPRPIYHAFIWGV